MSPSNKNTKNKKKINYRKDKVIRIEKKPLKLIFYSLFIYLLLFILIARLFYIQFVQAAELKEEAYVRTVLNSVISPKRGKIYDKNGKVLAASVQVDTITISPSRISVKNDAEATNALKEKVAHALADCLELDYEEVLVKVTSTSSIERIATKVDLDKVDKLKAWMKENSFYDGININEDSKRNYPYNTLASNLIGFCGTDNNGLFGLEYYWDDTLSGVPGKYKNAVAATSSTIPDENSTYEAAEDGCNITLSIDVNIQSIAEKYLKQAVDENNCKGGGCITIMDPSTGDILAMASYPDYNLNDPFTPTEAINKNWDDLSSEERTNKLYESFRNKPVSYAYEPGSVFKVILAATALEEDIVEPDTNATFYCSGKQVVSSDTEINCANRYGHGYQSLRNALENSCNPALIQLGQKIGKTTLYKYLEAFGLFEKTGIQAAAEETSTFHDIDSVGAVELATTSFGQRFTITPLQMITAACAIANDGVLVKPRIVTQIEDPTTGAITTIDPVEVRQVISSETAHDVRDMMQSVVDDGGGSLGAVKGYSVGGKTGTSEPNPDHPEDGYVSSFLAIAPVENTKVVVLLNLFNPKGGTYYGGKIAAPVVSQVLSEILPYLGIPSDDTEDTSNRITIPDLKGKSVQAAKDILGNLGLTCNTSAGNEEIVESQTPKAGVSITPNGIVTIYSAENSEKKMATVPNLKGMGVYQARSTLLSNKLNVQISGSGTVISQDPTYGTQVEEGTVIKINLKDTSGETH